MKIVIPGGSGCVGRLLARNFHARGDQVTVLSRTPRTAPSATAVLKSRRVVPRRLLDAGFEFTFPDWPVAVRDLAGRERASPQHKQRAPDQTPCRLG